VPIKLPNGFIRDFKHSTQEGFHTSTEASSMTLVHILAFSAFAFLAGWIVPFRGRGWILLGSSLLAVYWLQPPTPIRNLDFWLPTAAIGLTVLVWVITFNKDEVSLRSAFPGVIVILGLILLVGFTRYLEPFCCVTPTRPPEILQIALIILVAVGLGLLSIKLRMASPIPIAALAFALIIILFLILKSERLGLITSAWLRGLAGQDMSLASALDLRWLGFSYLSFRLLHVIRDHQANKLPGYRLDEFVTYALFFPAYTAGPIDRSQHFMAELRQPALSRSADSLEGSWRILSGVFKKFVLADSLALFALSNQNATQTGSSLWMWVLLYAYTLRIYLDFSGYTDIAIGLGRLMGIRLPENFSAPYLKTNLTTFWNSWHISLAQWFRAYFFNPVSRSLRSRKNKLPIWLIILVGQFGTMILIGLWHGINLNFLVWGLWHGAGLFIHNRWSDQMRGRLAGLSKHPRLQRLFETGGWLLTFNYVALGWVWFALPNLGMSWHVFQRLLGIS
jgi:alginate O-acetyltransferase complex protein AlgI